VVNLSESRAVVEALLDSLPQMFTSNMVVSQSTALYRIPDCWTAHWLFLHHASDFGGRDCLQILCHARWHPSCMLSCTCLSACGTRRWH
jgi:hypothetical protein